MTTELQTTELLTLDELYRKYRQLHDKYADGCKSSCGVMALTVEYVPTYSPGGITAAITYRINVGSYCVGLSRWDIAGQGGTLAACVAAAAATLDEWEQTLIKENRYEA